MKTAAVIQMLWSWFLLFFVGLPSLRAGNTFDVVTTTLTVTFAVAAYGCTKGNRFAWMAALALSLLPLIRWLPVVAINQWMFMTGHELYRESPATIYAVWHVAIVFVLPPLAVYVALLCDATRFYRVLCPSKQIVGAEASEAAFAADDFAPDDGNPYSPPRSH